MRFLGIDGGGSKTAFLLVDDYASRVSGNQPNHDVEAGGLTGSIWAQKSHHFALFYVEADAVDDPSSAVAFPDLISR